MSIFEQAIDPELVWKKKKEQKISLRRRKQIEQTNIPLPQGQGPPVSTQQDEQSLARVRGALKKEQLKQEQLFLLDILAPGVELPSSIDFAENVAQELLDGEKENKTKESLKQAVIKFLAHKLIAWFHLIPI